MSPGISFSASVISARPNSARDRSATLKSIAYILPGEPELSDSGSRLRRLVRRRRRRLGPLGRHIIGPVNIGFDIDLRGHRLALAAVDLYGVDDRRRLLRGHVSLDADF